MVIYLLKQMRYIGDASHSNAIYLHNVNSIYPSDDILLENYKE